MDFKDFPKIDAHFHATNREERYFQLAQQYNLRFLNINTDVHPLFPPVEEQAQIAYEYQQTDPAHFVYLCTFSMANYPSADFIQQAIATIDEAIKRGAVGVKIWKNIGMEVRKPDGSFLMIDDPLFAPLFDYLSANQIPVLAHLGEPFNCWLPLEEMTSDRNRAYFTRNPQYHAFLHPEIPSYEQQIAARDAILRRYPNLIFIGAHLGSLEWSYQELAKRLDAHPQFAVDVSSRLGHLQRQSCTDYEGVRSFFIRYADRLIYGTDAYNNLQKLESALINEWNYLATANVCTTEEHPLECNGLNLPEDVLYQLYFDNAKRYYKLHFSS